MSEYRIPKAISGFRKSYALVSSKQSAELMVVFVHGFGGSPTSTWLDFHGLVKICAPNYPWWDKADLFFYSYESIRTPVGVNAGKLAAFLEYVLSKDAAGDVRFPCATGGPHTRIVLVGHSEGGVVIRRMLLDRFKAIDEAKGYDDAKVLPAIKTDVALSSELRLFAPACMGTNFSSLLGFATSFSAFISAIASSSLVRNELKAGSPVLQPLETETENASKRFRGMDCFEAKVLFGDSDQVVYTASYTCDKIDYEEGQDHFSVCKPKFKYLRPLEFVR